MNGWFADAIPADLPLVLGHENAGWVHAVGPAVEHLAVGDPGRSCRCLAADALAGTGTGGQGEAGRHGQYRYPREKPALLPGRTPYDLALD
jgi:NADPH:quinone reductase-like Zn-dependent oxidoreductase